MNTVRDLRPKFIVGYNLECEYEIGGQVYRVRHGCHHFLIRPDYLPTVLALVGTITRKREPRIYPPREVVALFPGMVGARFTEDFKTVEYDGPTPETEPFGHGSTTVKHYEYPSY